MLANADLLDYDDEYGDENENHIINKNQNTNDAFHDYKLSSKNSFNHQSDIIGSSSYTANSRIQNNNMVSVKKNPRAVKDEEDEFLDDIINRNALGKSTKAPPAVNF